MQHKEAFQLYPVTVTGAGLFQGTKGYELDSRYARFTGIALKDQAFVNPPTIDTFNHDGDTSIMDKGFPIEFLQTDKGVDPDRRFKKLTLEARKKRLDIVVNDPGGNVYPYTLNFVLRLEERI